jgi:hypothetical protein
MLGVYVLYDRRGQLVYIGRSGRGEKAGIFGRIICHHDEQRWEFDTYSWFGVLPVSDGGMIRPEDELISVDQIVNNLEALLIHLIEPSWNGNGGSYKHIPKFSQVPV